MKVYVGRCVQFSVDSDPEPGKHCGRGEFFPRDCSLNKTSKGCGVAVVLMSTICLFPEFLYCITGLDVLDKIIVSGGTYG